MVLGEEVRGLLALNRDWRFVTGDASDINARVREIDPDARLIANVNDGRLAVAVWVRTEHLGDDIEDAAQVPVGSAGGAWVLAFTVRDELGKPMCGEPDQRVVDQMNRASTRNKRPDLQKFAEMQQRIQAEAVRQWESAMSDSVRAWSEMQVYDHWRRNSILPARIYVPSAIERN